MPQPIELTMLVWTAVLCLLLFVPYSVATTLQLGVPRLAGNRDDLPAPEGWIARARRNHANHVENLAVFAVLVLVGHLSNRLNDTTAVAAQVFFWSRLAHAACYLIGIPWARTVAFAVGLVAELVILVQIL